MTWRVAPPFYTEFLLMGVFFSDRYVDENAFSGLRILIDLDLSANDISKLKLKTFEDNPNLQVGFGSDYESH